MTQDEFDDIVTAIADRHVTIMGITANLRIQGDPQARRMEEEQMLMQNVLSALQDYDVTSDLLSESDIHYLQELATSASMTLP